VSEPGWGRGSLAALAALRRSVTALASASPRPEARLLWRELGNRLEAFEIFRRAARAAQAAGAGAGAVPAAPADTRQPHLAELVGRALSLERHRTVWTLEGLGYGHAERRAAGGAAPRDWLAADAAGLPASSLIAVHCGIGLSLARRRLAGSAGLPAAELRRELAGHLAACRELAPGHAPLLLEALGFIARLRFARRAGEVARELARLDAEAHACFWHGMGRALYFAPDRAAPWSSAPWRLIGALAREAPPGEPLDNALAGLAWGVTMVNLRHPRVLEEVLRRHAVPAAAAPAFAHGVSSAVLVWHDCSPDDPYLAAWRRHQPQPLGGEFASLWRRWVSGPAESALARGLRRARCEAGPGELFRLLSSAAAPAAPAAAAG